MNANSEMASCWTDDVGPSWVGETARLDERLERFARVLLDALELKPAEAVADVGCGVGATTLAIAQAVGAGGRVVGVDISRTMLAAASERDEADDKAAPIAWLEADAQTHAFEPASFDVVASRFGVMFFDDPTAAFSNLRAALRPGGRLAFVCWQEPAENPWFATGVDALRDILEFPAPPEPNAPGPYGLSDATRTHALLDAAGFEGIEIDDARAELPFSGTVDDMVSHLLAIGPVGSAVREAGVESPAAEAARVRLREAIAQEAAQNGLAARGAAWLVRAHV